MICFLFPSDPLKSKKPDDAFTDQIEAFRKVGFETAIISLEDLHQGECKVIPKISTSEQIVYRGWMLSGNEYTNLSRAIASLKAEMLIDVESYLLCHHLPNWYPLISDLTPQTVIFPVDVDLKAELVNLGWSSYFIKDYVKSLKTASGSLLRSTDDVEQLVENMIKYRGRIEGGFCIREVEEFVPRSEIRYFVVRGMPYAPDPEQNIPEIVKEVSCRIHSPFFSVDIVKHKDARDRVVEVGDGQVSDIVGWTAERLADIWKDGG